MTEEVLLTGDALRPEQVVAVAERRAEVRLGPGVAARMAPARAVVEQAVREGRVVYGITTGFGALANTRIDPALADEAQVALLRSHAAGVGPALPDPLVRAMLLLRARTLAQGHSGVRVEIVARLLDLLRLDLLPVVPAQGSVGASGDLAPFAHLALPLIGEGFLRQEGRERPAAEVLAEHGLAPLTLHAKEGLSLLNGTEGMLALGVLGLEQAHRLADAADLACALSVEALLGSARPFDPRIHELRPHPGQAAVAAGLRGYLEGSGIGASHHDDFSHAVQDAYSLRCAPQVHGAARDVLGFADGVLGVELGAVVDNPVVFPETGEVDLGRQLPRPAAGLRPGLRHGRRHRVEQHLGAAHRPDPRPGALLRPAAVPGHPARPQQRLHGHPVHRRRPRGREPGAVPSRLDREHPHLRLPGGPRLDGLGRRAASCGRCWPTPPGSSPWRCSAPVPGSSAGARWPRRRQRRRPWPTSGAGCRPSATIGLRRRTSKRWPG